VKSEHRLLTYSSWVRHPQSGLDRTKFSIEHCESLGDDLDLVHLGVIELVFRRLDSSLCVDWKGLLLRLWWVYLSPWNLLSCLAALSKLLFHLQ
jgi:hypothetical protein